MPAGRGGEAAERVPASRAGEAADREPASRADEATDRVLAEPATCGDARTVFVPAPLAERRGPRRAAHATVHAALELLRERLADDDETPLVLVTRGAVAVNEDERPDLAGAAVWGLMRSAQAEYPGRFVLVDAEPGAALPADVPRRTSRSSRCATASVLRPAPAADPRRRHTTDVSFGPTARCWSPAAPAASARSSRATSSSAHGVRTCCSSRRRGARRRGAPPSWSPS